MSHALWKQAWATDQIDFHQTRVNPLLQAYWPALALVAKARVFVPLCGKSLDMGWLLAQGCRVLGVEISPIAVAAFFEANALLPSQTRYGKFTRWHTDQVEILCGDYFDIRQADLADIDAVYDHAALQAFGSNMRKRYVNHMARILPLVCPVLLLSTSYPEAEDVASAFSIDAEISSLYHTGFSIELLHGETSYESHPGHGHATLAHTEDKVYLLRARHPA